MVDDAADLLSSSSLFPPRPFFSLSNSFKSSPNADNKASKLDVLLHRLRFFSGECFSSGSSVVTTVEPAEFGAALFVMSSSLFSVEAVGATCCCLATSFEAGLSVDTIITKSFVVASLSSSESSSPSRVCCGSSCSTPISFLLLALLPLPPNKANGVKLFILIPPKLTPPPILIPPILIFPVVDSASSDSRRKGAVLCADI